MEVTALVHCPECGKEISDKAPTCPYCGCPSDAESSKQRLYSENARVRSVWNAIGVGVLGNIFTFFISLMFGSEFGKACVFGLLGFLVFFAAYSVMVEHKTKNCGLQSPRARRAWERDKRWISLVALICGGVAYLPLSFFIDLYVAAIVGLTLFLIIMLILLAVSWDRISHGKTGLFDD